MTRPVSGAGGDGQGGGELAAMSYPGREQSWCTPGPRACTESPSRRFCSNRERGPTTLRRSQDLDLFSLPAKLQGQRTKGRSAAWESGGEGTHVAPT